MSFTTHIHKADCTCMFKEGGRCWYCKATIKRLHYCAMPLQRQTDLRKSSFLRGPLLSGFKGDEKIWLLLRSHFFFFEGGGYCFRNSTIISPWLVIWINHDERLFYDKAWFLLGMFSHLLISTTESRSSVWTDHVRCMLLEYLRK